MASAAKYLSNVAKSVKYASIDVLKSYNPVVVDAIETNEDVSKAVYSGIKNYRQIYSKTKTAIAKSEIDELAGELKHNLLADLKSGKFYNKEREERAMNDAVMGADLGFDDADFGFGGDDDLGFGSDDDMGFDDNVSISDTLDSVGERASNAINNVSVRSAEYQVEANRQSTNKLMGHLTVLSSQLHGDLAAINSNVANVMDFNANALATHMENSKTFYETQQRQMDEQTEILREILENQKKISGVGNGRGGYSSSDKVTVQDIFSSEGALDLKAYMKYAKQNATDSGSEIGDMIDMIKELNLGKALVANPVGMLTTGAIKSFLPKALKSAFQEMNDTIAGSFSTALLNLTKAKDSDNSIMSFLGNIFGLDLSPKKSFSTSGYEKGPVPWTGKDHKALTDVIPTLLGKIYSSVSGTPDLIYDYDNGKFTTRHEAARQYKNSRDRYVVQANDSILESLDNQIQKVEFANSKEKQQFLDDLEKVMKYNFEHMEKFNPNDKSLSAKTYGIEGPNADKTMELIRAMYAKVPKSKQLRNQNDLIDAVNSLNSWMKSIEETADSPFLKMNDDFEQTVADAGGRKETSYNKIGKNSDTATEYLKKQVEISTSQTALLTSIIEEIQNNGAISIDNTISNINSMRNVGWVLSSNKKTYDSLLEIKNGVTSSNAGITTTVSDYGIGDSRKGSFLTKLKADRDKHKKQEQTKAKARDYLAARKLVKDKERKRKAEQYAQDDGNTTSSAGLGYSDGSTKTMKFGEEINLDSPEDEEKNDFIERAKKSDKASHKLKTLIAGGGVELARLPLNAAAALIRKADDRLYNLFFKSEKNDDKKSISERLTDGFDDFFDTIKERAIDKLDDIKDKLTGDDFKDKIFDTVDKIFSIDSRDVLGKFKEAFFGDKNKGLFEGMKDVFVDGVKDMWKDTKEFWKPTTDTITGVKTEAGKAKDQARKASNAMKDMVRRGVKKDKDLNKDGTGERKAAFGAFSGVREEDRKKKEEEKKKNRTDKAASGIDRVTKTGVVAVSKGELILPPDMNPFNIKKREKNEDKQIKRFKKNYKDIDIGIPKFAEGGTVGGKSPKGHSSMILRRIFGTDDVTQIDWDTAYDSIAEVVPDTEAREKVLGIVLNIANKTRKANKTTREDYVKGKENIFTQMGDEASKLVKSVKESDFIKDMTKKYKLGGKSKQAGDIITDTTNNISDYMPSMAKGGIAGAFMSLFLPVIGLPLGTALGASVGLASKSSAIQDMLFGKKIIDKDGNETRDDSGILNKDLSKKIEKYFPNMSKGAIAGAITSILPFVPGGPVTGVILGSAIGFARTNENAKNALFGEGKFLNKAANYIKPKLGKMGLGALATTVIGGPFGFVGNAMLGAGLGFASDTNKFKDILFGPADEAGKRHGGLVGFFQDALEVPLNGIKNEVHKTIKWFDNTFVKRAGEWFDTITQSIENVFISIKDTITDHIKTKILTPIHKWMREKIMKPFQKGLGFIGKLGMGAIRNTIGAPFELLDRGMTKLREGQLSKIGKADRMSAAERAAKREQLIAKNNKRGQVRDAIGDFIGYDIFGIKKQRSEYANKIRNSESAKADTALNKMTTDELEKIVAKQKKIDPRALKNQNMSAEDFQHAQMAHSGLDKIITSNVNAGQIPVEYALRLRKAIKANDYEGIKNILNEDGAYVGQYKNDLLKSVDDATQKATTFKERWDNSIKRNAELEKETGIAGIGSRRAQASFEKELFRRKEAEARGEQTEPEAENTAEVIQDLDFNKKHDEVINHLKSMENALLHIAFPDQFENESAKARGKRASSKSGETLYVDPSGVARTKAQDEEYKKLHEERAKHAITVDTNGEAQVPPEMDVRPGNVRGDSTVNVTMSIEDMVNNGYAGEAKDMVKNSGFFGKAKNKILNTISKLNKKSKEPTTQITALGPIKTRIDNNGNEIPDERDSETKITLRKQAENDNTQKGILSKITDLTSHFKLFTGGEKEDKKKPSLLSKILKGALMVGGLVPKVAAGIGALAVAGIQVNTKKRNSKGEVLRDANGNPIMEKKPLIQALVEAGQRIWMGDDLTGKKSGIYFHIKNIVRDKILPAAGSALDYILKMLPKAIESGTDFITKYLPSIVESFTATLVKNLWPILKSLGKGIIKGIVHSKDDAMDSSEIDSQVGKLRDSNLTLGNNTSSATSTSGDKLTKAMQSSFDSGNTVSVSTGNATGSSMTSSNKNNIITSSNSGSSSTSSSGVSIGNASGAKPIKSNNKDVKKSKAYQNASKQTQKEALNQLSGIWDQKLNTGQAVSDLLNDDKTIIADIDTGNGQSYGITGADLLHYPELAQQVLGINISSLTNKQRNANTKASGEAPDRGHEIRNFVLRNGKRVGLTIASGGKNLILTRAAGNVVGGATHAVGSVMSHMGLKGLGGLTKTLGKGIKATGYGWSKVGDITKDIANGKGVGEAFVNAGKDAWKYASGKNKKSFVQKAKDVAGKAKNAASKVKNKFSGVKDATGTVEHFGSDVTEIVDNATGQVLKGAESATNQNKVLGLVDKASAKAANAVEHFGPESVDIIDDLGNDILRAGKAVDTAEDVASGTSTALRTVGSSKFVQLAAKTERAATKGGKLAGKAAGLVNKFKTLLSKFLSSKTFLSKLTGVLKKFADKDKIAGEVVQKAITKVTEKLTKRFSKGILGVGAKAISKIATKYASFFGSAGFSTAAFATIDFIRGFKNADVTFKVKKPTAIERFMSGFINVLGSTFCLNIFVPNDELAETVIGFLEDCHVDMSDLRTRQDKLEAEVKKYNTKNDVNLSEEEYLNKDKLGTKIKNKFNEIWDGITGKDKKKKKDDKKSSKKGKGKKKKDKNNDLIYTTAGDTSSEQTTTDTDYSYTGMNMNVTGTDYSEYTEDTDYTAEQTDAVSNANVTGTNRTDYTNNNAVHEATSGTGSVISQSNQQAIQDTYAEVNQSIPDMITTLKSNLASYFGLEGSDLSRTSKVGQNKFKGKGPTAIFNNLTKMWKMTNSLTHPMMNLLPKAMSSGMKSLSRFMAISLGMASPDDQNIDFTKIINDQGYLNTRAKRISESSIFYELFGGVSGNNSNDSSKQEKSADKKNSSSKSTKKSPIKSAFKKIAKFFTGSGSGMEDDDSENVDESKFDPSSEYFVSQKYGRYANTPFSVTGDTTRTTVADAGCAPAVASMAVNSTGLSKPLDMSDAIKDAIKYKKPNQGVSADYFIDEFKKHNIDSAFMTSSNNNYENTVKGRLKDQKPVILMGVDPTNTSKKNSPFGPESHYVVATKMDNDGNIYINDPEARKPNKKYDFKKVIKSTKLGILPSMKSGNKQGSSLLVDKLKKALGKYNAKGKYGPDTVQYKVWNAVRAAGYSEIATAALMGNIQHESAFNCGTKQVGGGGYGLIQWDGGRKPAMIAYCKSKGKPSNDPQCQIEYLLKELGDKSMWMKANSGYNMGSLTRDDWVNSKDIETSTKAFMCCFERPAYSASVNHIDRRIASAKEYYQEFTGTAIDSDISSGGDGDGTKSEEKQTLIDELISKFTAVSSAYGLTTSDSSSSGESGSGGSGETGDTTGISGNTVKDKKLAEKQKGLVAKMKSVEGKLKYCQNNAKYPGSRNPETGGGDCSSTVQWAYQNVLGVDPGGNTWAQEADSDTYTAATSTSDEKKLQLGDLLLKNGHVEMYAGNGKMIGHGGGKDGKTKGPTTKTLGKTPPYNIVRRWVGFKGKGSGLDDNTQDVSWAGSDSGYTENTPVKTYKTQPIENNNTRTVVQTTNSQISTSKKSDDSNAKLLELLIKLLAQVVDNTGSIKQIATLLVQIVEMKSDNSNTTNKEINEVKRDLVKTKASLTSMMTDIAQSQSNQTLEDLIRSVEAIAAQ